MPLRTSAISEAERQAIEAEWNTERSYSLSNLGGTRRAGLRFVKAAKTDEEWTRASRAGLSSSLSSKSKTSRQIADDNARWYRELVSGSSSSTTREGSYSAAVDTIAEYQMPVASTSKVTLDDLAPAQHAELAVNGQGSRDQPFTLDEEEEVSTFDATCQQPSMLDDKRAPDAVQGDVRHQQHDIATSASAVTQRLGESNQIDSNNALEAGQPETDAKTEPPDPARQDMYCLLCKIEVPAADVAGHRTTILHQLSKSSHRDDKPLVPPTHYGVRSSNVGYGMLQRLGWTEDTGLGSSQTGRKAPLKASDKHDRKGLGVDSKRRLEQEEREGKIVKRTKQMSQAAAKPLAKNRKELERAKIREMQMFKEGLAYVNT